MLNYLHCTYKGGQYTHTPLLDPSHFDKKFPTNVPLSSNVQTKVCLLPLPIIVLVCNSFRPHAWCQTRMCATCGGLTWPLLTPASPSPLLPKPCHVNPMQTLFLFLCHLQIFNEEQFYVFFLISLINMIKIINIRLICILFLIHFYPYSQLNDKCIHICSFFLDDKRI